MKGIVLFIIAALAFYISINVFSVFELQSRSNTESTTVTIHKGLVNTPKPASPIMPPMRWTLPPEYDYFEPFYDGLALVWNERGEACFIDTLGNVAIDHPTILSQTFFGLQSFAEGLAPVLMFKDIKQANWDWKFGYINRSLRVVVGPRYEYAGHFSQGLAPVNFEKNGLVGFVNKAGETVIEPAFTYIDTIDYQFKHGVAWVCVKKLWGLIDTTGEFLLYPRFDKVYPFVNGFSAVEEKLRWGFVDTLGKIVVPLKYDGVNFFSNGMAPVMLNERFGYVNSTGKEIVTTQYEKATVFDGGCGRIKMNNRWGLVNTSGKVIVQPHFEAISGFENGLAIYVMNGMYGYIDNRGKSLTDNSYEDGYMFYQGIALVKRSGKWGYIDTTGKYLIKPKYLSAGAFVDNRAIIRNKANKFGFINIEGDVVIEPVFDAVKNFSGGYAAFLRNNKYGFIDTAGTVVIDPQFEETDDFMNGWARVMVNGKWGIIRMD